MRHGLQGLHLDQLQGNILVVDPQTAIQILDGLWPVVCRQSLGSQHHQSIDIARAYRQRRIGLGNRAGLVIELVQYSGAQPQHLGVIRRHGQGEIARGQRLIQSPGRQQHAPQLDLGFQMLRVVIDNLVQQAKEFFPVPLLLGDLGEGEPCRGQIGSDLQGVLQFNARLEQIALLHQRQAFFVVFIGLFFRRRAGYQANETSRQQRAPNVFTTITPIHRHLTKPLKINAEHEPPSAARQVS
nr:hypothetical protein [uncultured Pseudomonas sp.]